MKPAKFLLTAACLASIVVLLWPAEGMISNELACAKAQTARGQQICTALSNEMRWTWLGHAAVSPGWRITYVSLREVFCRQHVTESDMPFLKDLAQTTDLRLEGGAQDLIRLIENLGGTGSEPENSVFNPKNPEYILKDGCRN